MMNFKIYRLLSGLFFFATICAAEHVNAMMSKSLVKSGLQNKTALNKIMHHKTGTRRTFISYETGNKFVDGTTGVVGGSVGKACGGFVCGLVGTAMVGMIIIPPCKLAGKEVSFHDIAPYTTFTGMVVGGIAGSSISGPVGIASFTCLITSSYAVRKYKETKNQSEKNVSH